MYNDRFEEDEQYENAHLYDDIMKFIDKCNINYKQIDKNRYLN